MTGLTVHPEGTLIDRVLETLKEGPRAAAMLCHRVLGLPGAPEMVCERIAIALLGADPRVRQFGDGRWGLVAEAQGSPLLDECAFAVVDVETTGMRAAGSDRITEIAVVVVHGVDRERNRVVPCVRGVSGTSTTSGKRNGPCGEREQGGQAAKRPHDALLEGATGDVGIDGV